MWRNQNPCAPLLRMNSSIATVENSMVHLNIIRLLSDSAIPLLVMCSKELKAEA